MREERKIDSEAKEADREKIIHSVLIGCVVFSFILKAMSKSLKQFTLRSNMINSAYLTSILCGEWIRGEQEWSWRPKVGG